MPKSEIEVLEQHLNSEYATRQRLGGYDANAAPINFLFRACLAIVRHISQLNGEVNKLKREIAKKKK